MMKRLLTLFVLLSLATTPLLAKKDSYGSYKSQDSSKTTNVSGYTKKMVLM
jgi:hypothetical protein